MKPNKDDKMALIIAGAGISLYLGFWGTVLYIAWHFISKYW